MEKPLGVPASPDARDDAVDTWRDSDVAMGGKGPGGRRAGGAAPCNGVQGLGFSIVELRRLRH